MSKEKNQPVDKHDSIFSLFLRVFWMLVGNTILVILTIFILRGEKWTFHAVDVVFWVTVLALILARYLDIKFYCGLTSTGEPASMVNWRKYAIVFVMCSAVIWVLAHTITVFS
jgi:hypothetical protein